MNPRLVVFDRDGTLIDFHRDPELGVVTPAFHPSHIRLLPTVATSLRDLVKRGVLLAVASNQPGAAKGELPRSAIDATMKAFVRRLEVEGIPIARVEICYHHPQGGDRGDMSLVVDCDCRKPRAGMLRAILGALAVDAREAWMVGDTPTDVSAGAAAGMRTALLGPTRRCELCPMKDALEPARPDLHAPTMEAIVAAILGET